MNYEDEMEEMAKSMNYAFLHEETLTANELRDKATSLTHRMFADNANIEQIGVELNTLAKEMIGFESQIINFPILNFLYADIGRTLLNLQSFEIAIQYALAGVEANLAHDDQEGITANKRVLLDAACFSEANEHALKMLEDNPELNDPHLHQLISGQPINASSEQKFEKLLRTKKRPKSLYYCLDKEKGAEERAIRTVMRQMGDSRATVLKYLASAKKMNKE
ncbi:hypothetical protein H5185_04790 [Shewanella sp. SG44-6]|uniref:hypothetical protein n=1 Tax=Shewanella sp. SG44-6 TaxID=2760959 RepID=UPI0016000DC9|nr:hypothetical protein [Shewanella sp. SG44-6]MBB1388740.1 hypothetical protein [Shewanella sp. SG44-6]